ncbi:MAG TPA: ABC transporter substrate-binding protein [Chloroflexota bacterium]|nr:ABC transporter substrate-binding protein [Chloroflexota bacterium]
MRLSQSSGVLIAILALVACGGGAAPTPASAPASAAASKPAAASAPASATGASKPAAASAASASAKPAASSAASAKPAAGGSIKVGYINSTTGSLANVGKDNNDAFQMYLDSIQSTVAGRKIEVVYADDAGSADTGLTKAKQLVESDKVNVLMGLTSTPICYAVAGYVKQVELPLIVSGNCGAESLMYDSKTAGPFIVRFTQNGTGITDTLADYGFKKGYRKAVLITSDYGGGLETGDGFGSAWVGRGGAIVQEIHPPLGTNDMGPYVSQISNNGDVLVTFMPGVDSLRFSEAYATYAGGSNRPVLDHFGGQISGTNFAQSKDKVVGITGNYAYSPALETPGNQALLKAWNGKYPNRPVSTDTGVGWSAAQILEAAVKQANGNVEDKQAFMNVLYNLKIETAKGPLSLDKEHDVVQNIYFWQAVKKGSDVGLQIVDTYKDVARTWDRTQDQIAKFQFGTYKGKWVGMTKEQLGDVLTLKP